MSRSVAVKVEADFENSESRSTCSLAPSDPILFERADWTLFRDLGTLAQKAGVPPDDLPELALKELWDNALDASPAAVWRNLARGAFYVEDDGPGIPGTDEEVASLFSVRRPLTSSKLFRLPTRGALGNGLRVVAGLALSTGGSIVVRTRGRRLTLTPRFHDGGNDIRREETGPTTGTRVELYLGQAADDFDYTIGRWIAAVPSGEPYLGRSSAFWYDSDSWFALFNAAGETPGRTLLAQLEGLSGSKAGKLASAFLRRPCGSLTPAETETLLLGAREATRPVEAKRLGKVLAEGKAFARKLGEFAVAPVRGETSGLVPFVVEVNVTPRDETVQRPSVNLTVNRTKLPGEVVLGRNPYGADKTRSVLSGCRLREEIVTGDRRNWTVDVSILTPYYPKTSDGKHPDLSPFGPVLRETLDAAIRKGRRAWPMPKFDRLDDDGPNDEDENPTIEEAVIAILTPSIAKATGNGATRFAPRQLFYVVRAAIVAGLTLTWGYFQQVIGKVEKRLGHDLPGIARDPRGSLYHPHTGETIPLGTRAVEDYRRPAWTFNKILFIEKEGFNEILKSARWPERHDCAIVTSKGHATRAVKDLLDLLGDSPEPVTVYCLHDADAAGTVIFQALVEETLARPRRRVRVINLGLEPAEALAMGLEVEDVGPRKDGKPHPVASYVEDEWAAWLQEHRVELNAMTSPQLLSWLDDLFSDTEKLVPPGDVLLEAYAEIIGKRIEEEAEDAVRERLDFDRLLEEEVAARREALPVADSAEDLAVYVKARLDEAPEKLWKTVLAAIVDDAIEGAA